jgi:hypothetical protein
MTSTEQRADFDTTFNRLGNTVAHQSALHTAIDAIIKERNIKLKKAYTSFTLFRKEGI